MSNKIHPAKIQSLQICEIVIDTFWDLILAKIDFT